MSSMKTTDEELQPIKQWLWKLNSKRVKLWPQILIRMTGRNTSGMRFHNMEEGTQQRFHKHKNEHDFCD